jgi:SAM-dependent methyltransferase
LAATPPTGILNPFLEREIARKFADIPDIECFPEKVASNSPQLEIVREVLGSYSGKRILDAGCARARFLKRLTSIRANFHGVDLTENFIRSAKTNVPVANFTQGSLSALPFASEVFDAVYCVEVLEHCPNTELAVSEMARVLKLGGTLLIIDKSLQGLDPQTGLPNLIAKPWAERQGKWMYPPDFSFKERWFWPFKLAGQMRQYCNSVRVRFIPEGRGKASRFYKLLPFLSLDVAWIAQK